MKAMQVKTFHFVEMPAQCLIISDMDDKINKWLKDNPGVEVEEKLLSTSTTAWRLTEDCSYNQTLVSVCLMIFYRLP